MSYNSFEKYLEIENKNYRRKSCTNKLFGGICKKYNEHQDLKLSKKNEDQGLQVINTGSNMIMKINFIKSREGSPELEHLHNISHENSALLPL